MNKITNLNSIIPKAYRQMFYSSKFYKFLDGGRSGGKSTAIGIYIVFTILFYWYQYKLKLKWIVCRLNENKLRSSTFNLLSKIAKQKHFFGLENEFKVSMNPLCITHIPSGSEIIFVGLRDEGEEIKGYEDITGIWIEEASAIKGLMTISNLGATMARPSTFNIDNPNRHMIKPELIMSFNPDPYGNTDWLYEEFIDKDRDDVLHISTTYRDNPFLTKDNVEQLLSSVPDKYKPAQIDGKRGGLFEETVLTNWVVKDFNPDEINFQDSYAGIDWGWTDPSTYIKVGIGKDGKLYVWDELYEPKLQPEEFADLIKRKIKDWRKFLVVADNAMPGHIDMLDREGIPIKRAKKTKLESNFIIWAYQYEIVIHPSCKNLIREIINWRHETDKKTGRIYEKTVDKDNHLIDALRYACNDWVWDWVNNKG